MSPPEIYSMTGFASHEFEIKKSKFVFNLKSVNGRFLELKVRTPRQWAHLEIEIRNFLGQYIKRGTAEFWVDNSAPKTNSEKGNNEKNIQRLLKDFSLAFKVASKTKNLPIKRGEIFELILRNPAEWHDIGDSDSEREDEKLTFETLKPALESLVGAFVKSRRAEGERITKQFLDGIKNLESLHKNISNDQAQWRQTWEENMKKRMTELSTQASLPPINEERILQEILILAEKRDIKEEIERIGFHLGKMRDIFNGVGGSVQKGKDSSKGKEIDFFLQELNREWTTLGNKIQRPDSSQKIVDSKLALEQLREQALNVL